MEIRVRIIDCSSKYTWYKDRIGEEFDVWEIEDSTLIPWRNDLKKMVTRNGVIDPVMTYMTMIETDRGDIFYRIWPSDCIDVRVFRRNDIIDQLI